MSPKRAPRAPFSWCSAAVGHVIAGRVPLCATGEWVCGVCLSLRMYVCVRRSYTSGFGESVFLRVRLCFCACFYAPVWSETEESGFRERSWARRRGQVRQCPSHSSASAPGAEDLVLGGGEDNGVPAPLPAPRAPTWRIRGGFGEVEAPPSGAGEVGEAIFLVLRFPPAVTPGSLESPAASQRRACSPRPQTGREAPPARPRPRPAAPPQSARGGRPWGWSGPAGSPGRSLSPTTRAHLPPGGETRGHGGRGRARPRSRGWVGCCCFLAPLAARVSDVRAAGLILAAPGEMRLLPSLLLLLLLSPGKRWAHGQLPEICLYAPLTAGVREVGGDKEAPRRALPHHKQTFPREAPGRWGASGSSLRVATLALLFSIHTVHTRLIQKCSPLSRCDRHPPHR